MSRVAIDLEAADQILRSYRATSASLTELRRSLSAPWSAAVAELGAGFLPVPDVLRVLADRTDAGARDLEWRVAYIRSRYPEVGGHRLIVADLPERLPHLQAATTAQLLERLRTGEDLDEVRAALHELLARSVGDSGVAVEVGRALTADDVDRLLTHPDLIGGVDDVAADLALLVSYAHTAEPLEVAHLFEGDQPIDVLRMVLLLRSGDYAVADLAEVLKRVAELMADPTFAWQYASLPAVLASSEADAKSWLFKFENPVIALASTVADPAKAFALLRMPGMVEFLLSAPATPGTGQAAADELAESTRIMGNLIDLANEHLATLSDTSAGLDPDAATTFARVLAESYDILLALRDVASGSRLRGDPVRDAAARLTAWHFSELAKGWPLGASSGDFARWLAASDEAMAALVVGASAFIASVMPKIVADFVTNPAAGDIAAAVPLDQLATVLSFLTFALSESSATPETVAQWRVLIDMSWMAITTVAPAAVIPGSTPAIQILRALVRRLANDGYSFLASSGGPRDIRDIKTVNDVLAELFFTIDGFNGSNDIADVRPLQLALFASILGYHLDAIDQLGGLADYVVDRNLIPPPMDGPDYPRFLELFAEATTKDSDLARHYISLWHLITEWATKGVRDMEIHTS